MRKRKVMVRPRSRNERMSLGFQRYAALWRRFDWGQRRWYKHTPYPNEGCRLWHIALRIIDRSDRDFKFFTADPSVFYQSPANFQNKPRPQDEQP